MNQQQLDKMAYGKGFIAALDRSGGSTPKALKSYGIDESAYSSEAEMFDLVHAMRTRIATSPMFTGDRILGAILFEMTMDRQFDGVDAADYLWQKKQIVPFVKVDKGLADEADSVRIMKPMPELDALLQRAVSKHVFGTKMRSFINGANEQGINAVVAQQFEIARQILAAGLMPIVEPEVSINAPDKQEAEMLLKNAILRQLDELGEQKVMLKLTIPSVDGLYTDLMQHPKVLRVVALSGGYSRDESIKLLVRNPGLIASFDRALTEGLNVHQSDDEFNATLNESIESIYQASIV